MKKVWIRTVLGALSLLIVAFAYYLFFVELEGTILDGSFRGIEIGSTKADVLDRIEDIDERHDKTLRIAGFYNSDGEWVFVGAPARTLPKNVDMRDSFYAADRWVLFSSSILQEGFTVYFENNQVRRISFTRAPLDP